MHLLRASSPASSRSSSSPLPEEPRLCLFFLSCFSLLPLTSLALCNRNIMEPRRRRSPLPLLAPRPQAPLLSFLQQTQPPLPHPRAPTIRLPRPRAGALGFVSSARWPQPPPVRLHLAQPRRSKLAGMPPPYRCLPSPSHELPPVSQISLTSAGARQPRPCFASKSCSFVSLLCFDNQAPEATRSSPRTTPRRCPEPPQAGDGQPLRSAASSNTRR